ncbi:cupin domain-containing protein [Actinospongicola halichondriae]|uniref:cupin domain-containing protein n=1 Tax=Actinospongicola halichondriae TaxID=3236844 RepID=UPI003D5AB05A
MTSPLVDALDLRPHPEGGWFREVWRSGVEVETSDGHVRATATSIHFLLHAEESSAWHRVASDEIWIAHVGTVTIELGGHEATPDPEARATVGTDVAAGQVLQFIVPAGAWQRTLPGSDDALVSCVVSPGFDFEDFELLD